jgi:hypothetical protein
MKRMTHTYNLHHQIFTCIFLVMWQISRQHCLSLNISVCSEATITGAICLVVLFHFSTIARRGSWGAQQNGALFTFSNFIQAVLNKNLPDCWMGRDLCNVPIYNIPWLYLLRVHKMCNLWSHWTCRQCWNIKRKDYGGWWKHKTHSNMSVILTSATSYEAHIWILTNANSKCVSLSVLFHLINFVMRI